MDRILLTSQEWISNRSFHPQRQKWTWEMSYLYCDFWCYLLWFCRMLIETSLKTVSLQFINRLDVIFVTFVCSWFSSVICITHKTKLLALKWLCSKTCAMFILFQVWFDETGQNIAIQDVHRLNFARLKGNRKLVCTPFETE